MNSQIHSLSFLMREQSYVWLDFVGWFLCLGGRVKFFSRLAAMCVKVFFELRADSRRTEVGLGVFAVMLSHLSRLLGVE